MAYHSPKGTELLYRLDGGGAEVQARFVVKGPGDLSVVDRVRLSLARRRGDWRRVLTLILANSDEFDVYNRTEWPDDGVEDVARALLTVYDAGH